MFQKLIAKIVGKLIKRKLDKENKMEDSKKWYQSQTIRAGLVAILLGVYNGLVALSPQLGWNLPPVPEWLLALIGGIAGEEAIRGRINASKTIG